VERYNREEVISGAALEEKLKQYNEIWGNAVSPKQAHCRS